jgi:hypothetical protein
MPVWVLLVVGDAFCFSREDVLVRLVVAARS